MKRKLAQDSNPFPEVNAMLSGHFLHSFGTSANVPPNAMMPLIYENKPETMTELSGTLSSILSLYLNQDAGPELAAQTT